MADAQNMLRMLADFLEGAGYEVGERLSDSAFEVTDPDGDVYALSANFLRQGEPPTASEDDNEDGKGLLCVYDEDGTQCDRKATTFSAVGPVCNEHLKIVEAAGG